MHFRENASLLARLTDIGFAVVSSSESALMRAVLREWCLDASRKVHKQRQARRAVVHAMMSMSQWIFAMWRAMLERTPAKGYAQVCAAIRDADYRADLDLR